MLKKISSLIFASMLFAVAASGQTVNAEKEIVSPIKKPLLSYGIVVDNSGSYRTIFEEIIRTAKQIIAANNSEDEAFLVRFIDTDNVSLLQDFTSSEEELRSAADEMFIEAGQTAILDGVYFSAKHLASDAQANRRKVLIVITDGEDRKSTTKIENLLKFLKDEKIRVFMLGVSDGKIYKNLLEKLAKETGGKSFIAEKRSSIEALVKELTVAVRAQ